MFGIGKKNKDEVSEKKAKFSRDEYPDAGTFWCSKQGDPQHTAVMMLKDGGVFRGEELGHRLYFRGVGDFGNKQSDMAHDQALIQENWRQVSLPGMDKLHSLFNGMGVTIIRENKFRRTYHVAVIAMLEQQVLEDPSIADKLEALHKASEKAEWEAGIDAKRSYDVTIPDGLPAKVLRGYLVLSRTDVTETTETTLTVKAW